jgi:hypothetical protein
LIAQKSPTIAQICGGSPGASVLFLTVIAKAEALPKRSAAKATKASFIMRMRFLHTITSTVENTPGRILVQSGNPARQKPLENGGNTPFL